MAPDEVLAWIKVPKAKAPQAVTAGSNPASVTELCRAYKVSKRFEDDISAVCLVIRLQLADGWVQKASIGAGGVAATPVRARHTEAVLQGQQWNVATVAHAIETLRGEFAPISDMRASAAYRSEVLGNLLQRFWLESQGTALVDLQQLVCEGENA
jgi:xanthine dehydrogenase small subunit